SAVIVNLTAGTVSGGAPTSGATILYNSIENVRGTGYNDQLTGDADNNVLDGMGGNDILKGNNGNDALYGYDGKDKLYGGAGNDTLDGIGGLDTMDGGDGNDYYVNDIVSNGAGGYKLEDPIIDASGIDTLEAVKQDGLTLSSYYTVVLQTGLENLRLYDG